MSCIRSSAPVTAHFRFGAILYFVSLCFLLGAPHADAYFNSVRPFEDNSVTAAVLDIALSENTASGTITPTQTFLFDTILAKKAESISPQYSVYATGIAGTLCTKLSLTGAGGGATTTAPLAGFTSATSSVLGAWSFRLATTTNITAGETCTFTLSWFAQSSETSPSAIGFSDTEHMTVSVTAADDALPLGVVLNEILPNPEDGAAGVLGREFIELYNNGSAATDVLGWKISEMSGSSEAFYTIGNTASPSTVASPNGSTIIPAHGFLVLVFHNGNKINNTGDTIRLYNSVTTKIDEYAFTIDSGNDADTDSNATPGSENTGGGSESAAQQGKSHARIPDGTGAWVDPIPTPGEMNIPDSEPMIGNGQQATSGTEQTIPNTAPAPIPDQTTEEPMLEEAVVKEEELAPIAKEEELAIEEERTEPEEPVFAEEETPHMGAAGTSPESSETVSPPPQDPEPAREEETAPAE